MGISGTTSYARDEPLSLLESSVCRLMTFVVCAAVVHMPGAEAGEPTIVRHDEEGDGVAQIIVTAERRSADVQAVPLSVSVLTAEDLRSRTLRNSVDLAASVPGLQFDRQGIGAAPFIRGVGTVSGAVGNESPIALYVDGVYFPTPNASIFALEGVRQIEVLKGPQGTLFGRNATGGVIQVQTRDPEMEPSAELGLQYGSYSRKQASAYVTGGIGASVAASMSLYGSDQNRGWGENLETQQPAFRSQEIGGRGKLSWEPTPQTRVRLTASYLRRSGEDGLGYHIVPGSLGVDGRTRYSGFYNSWADPQDNAAFRHTVLSARVEQELPAFNLVSITAWQNMRGFFLLDQDMTPARIVAAPISQYGRTITQELQALSSPAAPMAWILGAYYLNDVAAYDPLSLQGAAALPFESVQIHSRLRTESAAVFGQTSVPLTSRTKLTAGIRYTQDERRVAGKTVGLVNEANTSLSAARQEADWGKPTWRVALSSEVNRDVMAYVSWDRGFKSGLFNLLTYASASVNPEVLDAYQAGLKSEWLERRWRVNVSGFVYQYRNIQVEEIVAGAVLSMNAAAARMKGADIEIDYAPSRFLSVQAAVALLQGRYTDFKDAPINIPTRNGAGALLGGNTVVPGDAAGFQTVRSPKRTVTLNARYTHPTQRGEVGLNAAYYRNSGFAWDPDNRLRQRAYDLVSVSIDWTSPDEKRVVRAAATNLNDAEVCVYASATALGDLCSPRAPRALSIEWSMTL